MTEVKLTRYDFMEIAEIARKEFLERAPTDNFLCECYVSAVKAYLARKDWMMKDGKIYEKEK